MAYHSKSLRFLSGMQILLGSILFFLGIIIIMRLADLYGFGIWVGVWMIITGLLGLSGSRDQQVPNQCLLGTFMGFTITACVMAGTMLICYSIALAELEACSERQDRNRYTTISCERFMVLHPGIGYGSVVLTIAVLEFALGLASSIFCCDAICSCCNGTSRVQGTQQVVYPQPTAPSQVSTASGGVVVMSGDPPSIVNVVKPPEGHFIVPQPLELRKEQEAPPAYNYA